MSQPNTRVRWRAVILRSLSAVAALLALAGRGVGEDGAESSAVALEEHANRPIPTTGRGYVSSENCRACHTEQFDTWHASHHRTMTQVPSRDSVIADFDNKVVRRGRWEFRFHHDRDDYFMTVSDTRAEGLRAAGGAESAPSRTFKVALSTGAHHQQAFWCETGRGRTLSTLPFIWINKEQRWVPYRSIFFGPPSSRGVSMHAGLWNNTCIKCHVVGGQPRLDAEAGADSRVAEFGISCEACHGPGLAHATAKGVDLNDERYAVGGPGSEIVNPATLPHKRSSQVCGQCHAVFDLYNEQDKRDYNENGFAYRPGDELTETRHVFRVGEGADLPIVKRVLERNPDFYNQRYWSDGMVRVSGREYNGLLETPCYQRGTMSCLSCHDMHPSDDERPTETPWADDQMGVGMRGNQACVQCHREFESQDRLVKHTHHAPDSSGSVCYNCHMPHTTLGLMKAMRSHTIDSPDAASTVATGRPNACNLCHLDQTLAWTADRLERWYKIPPPELSREQREIASSVLWILRGDAGQRGIVGWHYGWGPARQASGTRWMIPYLAELLTDPYDVVRFIAYHALKESPDFADTVYDFVGSSGSQARVASAVRARWDQAVAKPLPAESLLIRDAGRLDQARFRVLRDQRLDPPVALVE